jgi:hypothetical protein
LLGKDKVPVRWDGPPTTSSDPSGRVIGTDDIGWGEKKGQEQKSGKVG